MKYTKKDLKVMTQAKKDSLIICYAEYIENLHDQLETLREQLYDIKKNFKGGVE